MHPKECAICASDVKKLKITPDTCNRQHTKEERACSECWEAHLSHEVENRYAELVQCLFCDSILPAQKVQYLAHKDTYERYNRKSQVPGRPFERACQDRCAQSKIHGVQYHDPAKDGRVFECLFCAFQTCINCDRPEHIGETCVQYQSRLQSDRDQQAVSEAYISNSKVATASCPSCKMPYKLEGGCGYLVCTACKHRFCTICKCPWVGEGSQYLVGKAAHGQNCSYRTKDETSQHALKKRFKDSDEVAARLEAKRAARKERKEARLAAKRAAEAIEDEPGPVAKKQTAKKQKSKK